MTLLVIPETLQWRHMIIKVLSAQTFLLFVQELVHAKTMEVIKASH